MNNKIKIMETALALFAERGYDAVGVMEICEKSGITKPTLYHYFNNKKGLLLTIADYYFNTLPESLVNEASYNGDVKVTLNNVVSIFFRYSQKHPLFYRLLLSSWFAPAKSEAFEATLPLWESLHRIIENIFINASMDHGNMKGRHKIYAVTFLGMINTYIGVYINNYITPDDELIRKITHQFMHGIFS